LEIKERKNGVAPIDGSSGDGKGETTCSAETDDDLKVERIHHRNHKKKVAMSVG
jgi:hypothetical protein